MPPDMRNPAVLADGRANENLRKGLFEHPENTNTDRARQVPGPLLSHAAVCAFGAQRFAVSCLCRVEEADAAMDDQSFVEALDLDEVNLPSLIERLGVLGSNLQRVADAYGNDQVATRFRGRAT